MWDSVVIGGGCNGLAAAALLAKSGQQTLLLEQRPFVGGLSGAFEFQSGHWIGGMRPYARGVNLELLKPLGITTDKLTWHYQPELSTIRDGDGQTIDPTSEPGFVQYRTKLQRLTPVLRQVFGAPARKLSVSRVLGAIKGLACSKLAGARELARWAPLSAQDFLDEFFSSDSVKGALTAPMLLRTHGGPWTPFGALQIMLHEASGGDNRPNGPLLTQLLSATALNEGVTIQTGHKAIAIYSDPDHLVVSLADGTSVTARSVIAACSRRHLFESLLEPALTSSESRLRAHGTCAVLAVSMDSWPESLKSKHILCALDMTTMERAFDSVKCGSIPDQQVLDVAAPHGDVNDHAVRVCALQTPHTPAGGWTREQRNTLEKQILEQLTRHIPELSGRKTHTHLWTPTDLENDFVLPGGHLWHFQRDLDQLTHPPMPEAPKGVFWGNANMESGFACASGVDAARTALATRNRR